VLQELLEGLEASRRSTDADDSKASIIDSAQDGNFMVGRLGVACRVSVRTALGVLGPRAGEPPLVLGVTPFGRLCFASLSSALRRAFV
jgi:hypothetical protein